MFIFVDGESISSFGFKKFEKDSRFLGSEIGLYGDAKVVKNGSFVKITQPRNFSGGRVMYKKPIKELEINGSRKVSFGTYFSFSLSRGKGDGYDGKLFGLSNELIQKKNRAFFAVEIDTKMDAEFGDLDDNHVGINMGSLVSVKVANVSKVKLLLNSGKTLQCWIDYEASSKRIEVRLSKTGKERPIYPVLSFPIDLSEMFKNEEVYIGISSSNANSTQVCKLYSWSFKLRQIPIWMHSHPLDPQTFTKHDEPVISRRKSDCTAKVLTALVIGTACGALGAYIVMFIWNIFVTKKPVAPEEYVSKPMIHDYDKFNVLAVHIPVDGNNNNK
ncbi:putative L-type lectin-domain containing receptor kinase S.7 [Bienertia sinuspersici]